MAFIYADDSATSRQQHRLGPHHEATGAILLGWKDVWCGLTIRGCALRFKLKTMRVLLGLLAGVLSVPEWAQQSPAPVLRFEDCPVKEIYKGTRLSKRTGTCSSNIEAISFRCVSPLGPLASCV